MGGYLFPGAVCDCRVGMKKPFISDVGYTILGFCDSCKFTLLDVLRSVAGVFVCKEPKGISHGSGVVVVNVSPAAGMAPAPCWLGPIVALSLHWCKVRMVGGTIFIRPARLCRQPAPGLTRSPAGCPDVNRPNGFAVR